MHNNNLGFLSCILAFQQLGFAREAQTFNQNPKLLFAQGEYMRFIVFAQNFFQPTIYENQFRNKILLDIFLALDLLRHSLS